MKDDVKTNTFRIRIRVFYPWLKRTGSGSWILGTRITLVPLDAGRSETLLQYRTEYSKFSLTEEPGAECDAHDWEELEEHMTMPYFSLQ